jgi:transposase
MPGTNSQGKTKRTSGAAKKGTFSRARHPIAMRHKAYDMFTEGKSYKAVATQLGISMYTARDWKRSYDIGLFRLQRREAHHVYTDEQKVDALRLRREGLSYNAISKAVKVNRATIIQWVSSEKSREGDAARNEEGLTQGVSAEAVETVSLN